MAPATERPASNSDRSRPVVMFDGVCKFCNGSVQFLIRHDKRDALRFAALQSDYARARIPAELHNDHLMDTIILAEEHRLYTRSTAILKICKHLGGPWSLLYTFMVIPRPIRDLLYRLIARYRYKLFGKYDSCMMPTEAVRRKFVDQ